jgi:trimeric autotransporter adhesin
MKSNQNYSAVWMRSKKWIVPFSLLLFLSCIETQVDNPEKEDDDTDDTETVVNVGDFSNSYAEALAGNYPIHEIESDYTWTSSSVTNIVLNGQSATTTGSGASINGSTITIQSAGNYSISGSLSNGQILVDTPDTAVVRLILNNAEISHSSGIPLWVKNAKKAIIVLNDNTSNTVSNLASAADSTKAALYCQANLTICGSGKLKVLSSKSHGIVSTDGLIIASATLQVNAAGNGIKGKDYLVVKSGTLGITAGGDGLKSDNTADATKGYIAILSGTIEIEADEDALDAQTDAIIVSGNFELKTTGTKSSSKGIKGQVNVIVEGGNFNLNCADNAIHTSGNVAINGGTLKIQTSLAKAHGINSKNQISISGGTIGIEIKGDQSKAIKSDGLIALNGGDIHITTSGNAVLEASGSGFDVSYCTAIKSDTDVEMNGSNVTIASSGIAGKGISTDGNFTITAGQLVVTTKGNGATYKNTSGTADAYNATCISCDGSANLIGGTITLSSSGTAGKGISTTGGIVIGSRTLSPVVSVTTTGSKITVSSSTSTGGNRPGGGGGQTSGDYSSAKALKSDSEITINNGTVTISSADDGIKSEKGVTINNGTVTISKSTEGIEGPSIVLNGGEVQVAASDDGLNATAGTTAGGTESNDGSILKITGGLVAVSTTGGDGLDSNGRLEITGGTVIVQGPQSSPEVGMDINGDILFNGGLIVVSNPNAGNMIETPSTSSSQYSVKVSSSSIGTNLFRVEDANGKALFTFKPTRSAYNITFSSPELKNGSSYSIYTGGSITGTSINGYSSEGTYSGGTLKKTFTVSGKVTTVSY